MKGNPPSSISRVLELSNFLYAVQNKKVATTKNTVNLFLESQGISKTINFQSTGFFYGRRVVNSKFGANLTNTEELERLLQDQFEKVPVEYIFMLEEYGYQKYRDTKISVVLRSSIVSYAENFELGRESKLSNRVYICNVNGDRLPVLKAHHEEYYTMTELTNWWDTVIIPEISKMCEAKKYYGSVVFLMDGFYSEAFLGHETSLENNTLEIIYMSHDESKKFNPLTVALNEFEMPFETIGKGVMEQICSKLGFTDRLEKTTSEKTKELIEKVQKTSSVLGTSHSLLKKKSTKKSKKTNNTKSLNYETERVNCEEECYLEPPVHDGGSASLLENSETLCKTHSKPKSVFLENFDESYLDTLPPTNELLYSYYIGLNGEMRRLYRFYKKNYGEQERLRNFRCASPQLVKDVKVLRGSEAFKEIGNYFEQFVYMWLNFKQKEDALSDLYGNRIGFVKDSFLFKSSVKTLDTKKELKREESKHGVFSISQITTILYKFGIFSLIPEELKFLGIHRVVAPTLVYPEEYRKIGEKASLLEMKRDIQNHLKDIPQHFIFNFGVLDVHLQQLNTLNFYKTNAKTEKFDELRNAAVRENELPIENTISFIQNQVMVCISGDGRSAKPYVKFDTAKMKMALYYKKELNSCDGIYSNNYGTILEEEFSAYFNTEILNFINTQRSERQYEGVAVILINEFFKKWLEALNVMLKSENVEVVYVKEEIAYFCEPVRRFEDLMIKEITGVLVRKGVVLKRSHFTPENFPMIKKILQNEQMVRTSYEKCGFVLNEKIEMVDDTTMAEMYAKDIKELVNPIEVKLRAKKYQVEIKYAKMVFRVIFMKVLEMTDFTKLENEYDLYDYLFNNNPILVGSNFEMFLDDDSPKRLTEQQIENLDLICEKQEMEIQDDESHSDDVVICERPEGEIKETVIMEIDSSD
ncbi:hypothetical protein EIN_096290 [Entamoeba invadens IP1]|uniref:Uncharacterized protein n=1 Tax=Entamoeba invadens IP1 TaxID=370355 RepID=A0A0A1U0G6_ENTIV|nr:hypothetical protein EIN_096290 [Entamoeba invadens IP1]ELP87372.1 hypothetical protein EIN_096290 [Entamoeba invadens IP1]|eukprot:XP_004254143.1 hypothetical protein EIN_096290 [Entamoeba invadens IP1]